MDKEMKWRLIWRGQKDSPELRAVAKYLEVFPMFKDSEAKLISYAEYVELVRLGEIAKPVSYWGVADGQVGLVCLKHYSQYTTTWAEINEAKTDYLRGWRACKKS